MSGDGGLTALLRGLDPVLNDGVYVFATVAAQADLSGLDVVASVREPEGLTIVVDERAAREAGLTAGFRAAWITLRVHSELDAVGLTAAVAGALATAGIACNVVAGTQHDHLFVPAARAVDAVACLRALQQRARGGPGA